METLPDADDDPVPGILGGLQAYLDYMGIDSLDELEEEQLQIGFEALGRSASDEDAWKAAG
jgi:hypothetical protein